MLNTSFLDRKSHDILIRKLTDNPKENSMAIGCTSCRLQPLCGGLHLEEKIFDCLDLCCEKPKNCTTVCRNNPGKYTDYHREIDGFQLGNIPRAQILNPSTKNGIVPLIYHGSNRSNHINSNTIALRLPDLINFSTGNVRFKDKAELCASFHIKPEAEIILTGVNRDKKIESWWSLNENRSNIIKKLIKLEIKLITAPNFSVALDQPRYDDMHAMKRIGLMFSEFQNAGIPCALHPNGRTEKDFARWEEFIAAREEVQVLAYEFTTGPGRKERIDFHLEQLSKLSNAAGRSLDIVIFGKPEVIPDLKKFYRNITYIETTGFVKTIKRQRACRLNNDSLTWEQYPTPPGEPLDSLMNHNLHERDIYLKSTYY